MSPSCETWTPDERLTLELAFGLDAVLAYTQISRTQLSLGRLGGCHVNGHHFTYLPETDELLRTDALVMLRRLRAAKVKAARAASRAAAKAAQSELI